MFSKLARTLIALTIFTATASGGLVLGTPPAHASVCGVLEHVSGGPNGVQVFRGIRHGHATVNFSRNGVITSRMGVNVAPGQFYRFDGRGAHISVTC